MNTRGSIALGPGGVLYLVVSALILAAAIYTQANLLFGAFGLVMGGLIVSAVWTLLAVRGLEVRRELPAAGVVGEALMVRYTVANHSRVPAFSVVVEECSEAEGEGGSVARSTGSAGRVVGWVTHVGPGQKVSVEAPCWPTRRGELLLSEVAVWTAFPFGVFRRTMRRRLAGRVLVLPGLRRIDRRWLPTSPWSAGYGVKQRGASSDAGEFFGLREYREGDPPRVIDWKRSARLSGHDQGRLIARELTQPTPPRVMVLLDLSERVGVSADVGSGSGSGSADARLGSAEEEDAITLAASLLDAGHRQGFWTGLAVLGPACGVFSPQVGLPHRARMLEALAGLDLGERGHRPASGLIVPSVLVKPADPGEAGRVESGPGGWGVRGGGMRVLRGDALARLSRLSAAGDGDRSERKAGAA